MRATSGWTMASRSPRATASAKTRSASHSRSISPPGARTEDPKRSVTREWAGVRAGVAGCASSSASMTTAPRRASIPATVDFPEPIPPVSPTSSIEAAAALGAAFAALELLDDRLQGDILGLLVGAGFGSDLCGRDGRRLDAFFREVLRDRLHARQGSREHLVLQDCLRGDPRLGGLLCLDLGLGDGLGLVSHTAHRQADTAPGGVHVNDLDPDLLVYLHDLLGRLHVLLGQLRDVHETFDPFADPDERPKRHQLGHGAGDDLTGGVLALEFPPGVLLG